MEIEAQDFIAVLTTQRNAMMDELAKAHAFIAKLERQLAQSPSEPTPTITNEGE